MQGEQTLYEVLDVAPDATLEDIKKAHRKAMRVYHPDVYSGSREEGETFASRINKAYATLSNATKRERYDASLRGEDPENEAAPADADDSAPFEDTWGTEAEWEEEVDEEVVEDPPPTPQPEPPDSPVAPPPPSTWQDSSATIAEDAVRFTTPMTGLRIPLLIGLSGIIVGLAMSLFVPKALDPSPAVITSLGALAGLVLGALLAFLFNRKGKEPSPPRRPLLAISGSVIAAVVLGLLMFGFSPSATALIAGASGAVSTYTLALAAMARSMLDKIVGASALRKNNTFGALPGGVGPDLLNRTLSALYAIPSVRIMRNPDDDGLFSHAVTNGRKVVFVKAITGFSGLYRWSGPSLLRDRSGDMGANIPEEVLRATYREFSMKIARNLPKGAEVETWLFVYTQDGDRIIYPGGDADGNPKVTAADVGLDQVGRFLIDGETEKPSVDQETFVKTFSALLG